MYSQNYEETFLFLLLLVFWIGNFFIDKLYKYNLNDFFIQITLKVLCRLCKLACTSVSSRLCKLACTSVSSGLIYDHTKSYTVPFLLAGIPPVVCAFVLCLVHYVPNQRQLTSADTDSGKSERQPLLPPLSHHKPHTDIV